MNTYTHDVKNEQTRRVLERLRDAGPELAFTAMRDLTAIGFDARTAWCLIETTLEVPRGTYGPR